MVGIDILRKLSRWFTGIVFLFSGFVKAVDPLGSAFKFGDYFIAFRLEFLDPITLPLSMFLSAFEIVLGLILILGYQKKIAYWVLLVFMSFFTLLTLVLALTNPVSDCGCFGDALILTNWQTFLKNMVLMVFVLVLFAGRKTSGNVLGNGMERFFILIFFSGSILLSLYSLRHLPLIDFRPYDIGTSIPEEMSIPEDAAMDEYETTLFYQNLETGEERVFTIENYPRDTARWKFVTSESKLISKGYEPLIHDFGISDPDGSDITDMLLSDKGYTLLLIAYDLTDSDPDALYMANDWYALDMLAGDFNFIAVTATASTALREIIDNLGLDYPFYSGDETMLKTVVRSNPGFVLLKNGIILGKWSYRDLPPVSDWGADWNELIEQNSVAQDPEIEMMIQEGLLEDFNWNVIDFEEEALPVVMERLSGQSEARVWAVYILTVLLLLILLKNLAILQTRRD
jgi:hypothetical protein